MTTQQIAARKRWRLARHAYRTAERGQRNSTRKALTEAATGVLVADIAARKRSRQ